MLGLTDYITTYSWEDIVLVWYVLIADAYHALQTRHGAWRRRGPAPTFTDPEVITVALFIDTFFGGNEELGLAFIRQYHAALWPALLPNGQFNARRRAVRLIIEQIRRHLTTDWGLITPDDTLRLLDVCPVQLTTYTRGSDNQTACGQEFFGVCPSKGSKVYGFKLHLTTTARQVVDNWVLVPASLHDSQAVDTALEGLAAMHVLADGAYNNPGVADQLQRQRAVTVWATPRKDSRYPWPAAFREAATRWRRKVETVFSVLATVFHIEAPQARSLDGVIARVATRLLAYNLSFITRAQLAKLPV
jgi:hypothetical protein